MLEVSGIGQPERLKALGIPVVHELQGVGENLRDHYAPRMKWRIPAKGLTYNDRARGLGLVWQALKFAGARPACSACRPRRSAPISAPGRGWRARTP